MIGAIIACEKFFSKKENFLFHSLNGQVHWIQKKKKMEKNGEQKCTNVWLTSAIEKHFIDLPNQEEKITNQTENNKTNENLTNKMS